MKNKFKKIRPKRKTNNQGEIKTIKKYTYDNEDTPLFSKQKEIFYELVDKKLEEITNLDKRLILMI